MNKITKLSIVLGIVATLVIPTAASAKSYNPHHGPTYKVGGYVKKNGTRVKSYQRTLPNRTKWDNLYIPSVGR